MCFAPHGVQFFISHLPSWLRTRRFSEPTFRLSGATNHWKNTVFRDFPTFLRTWIFRLRRLSLFDLISFSLLFSFWSSFFSSSLTLPIAAFHLSILSEVWLLNFLRSYDVLYIYYIYITDYNCIYIHITVCTYNIPIVSQQKLLAILSAIEDSHSSTTYSTSCKILGTTNNGVRRQKICGYGLDLLQALGGIFISVDFHGWKPRFLQHFAGTKWPWCGSMMAMLG